MPSDVTVSFNGYNTTTYEHERVQKEKKLPKMRTCSHSMRSQKDALLLV
jgi:hypothetical protein